MHKPYLFCMRIGIIAGSYKPFHAGHFGLITLAARECDTVHLYVSTSDRARPGEVPILGSDMKEIWTSEIEKIMPGNVEVIYGGSPVGNVIKELGAASEAKSKDTFVLYADPDDMAVNFPQASLVKYASHLAAKGQIEQRPVKRTETVNVSGTKMREYLSSGDKASFTKNLPKGINVNNVWNILYSTAKAPPVVKTTSKAKTSVKKPVKQESLLRTFVEEALKD